MHKELSVKSRVRGDFHVRFCERVKLPRSTRPVIHEVFQQADEYLSSIIPYVILLFCCKKNTKIFCILSFFVNFVAVF